VAVAPAAPVTSTARRETGRFQIGLVAAGDVLEAASFMMIRLEPRVEIGLRSP